MLAARSRFASIAKRTFASQAEATAAPADKKYKVVVVGGGPGGLSGKLLFLKIVIGTKLRKGAVGQLCIFINNDTKNSWRQFFFSISFFDIIENAR